jgi:hypothetical protein
MTRPARLVPLLMLASLLPCLVGGTDIPASSPKSPTYTAPHTSEGFAPPKKTIYSGAVASSPSSYSSSSPSSYSSSSPSSYSSSSPSSHSSSSLSSFSSSSSSGTSVHVNPYSAAAVRAAEISPAYSTPDAASAAYASPSAMVHTEHAHTFSAPSPASSYSAYSSLEASSYPQSSSYGAAAAANGVDDYNYHHEIEAPSGIDFIGRFLEAIPLFLAVLVAFLLAQVVAPWLYQLLLVAVSLVPISLAYKAPLLNALLLPFGLTLCTTAAPPAVFSGTSIFTGRDLSKDFLSQDIDEDQWDMAVSQIAERGVQVLKGKVSRLI